MEANRLSVAIIYFATGLFFTYVAIQSVDQEIWNVTTIVLIIVATLSFGASIRFLWNYIRNKLKR